TFTELVEDLVGHLDKAAPEDLAEPEIIDPKAAALAPVWQSETPVLCVAGLGPLDEAAAAMLCQLLSKHGIGARIASYEAVSRGNINLLDLGGIGMVCISSLDITGRQAHLRYLIGRLRLRLPKVPIVVGLWPRGEASPPDGTSRTQLGAD